MGLRDLDFRVWVLRVLRFWGLGFGGLGVENPL